VRRIANRHLLPVVVAVGLVLAAGDALGLLRNRPARAADDGVEDHAAVRDNAPTTIAEARGRARILHETLHGALQVMHRDFFREDEGAAIPSRSLEDVFLELARSYDIDVRWLAVNTDAMSIDHVPQDEFEKNAVKALASGKLEFEASQDDVYRHAGLIRLASQCLKCHAPRRTTTEDRAAALVITMPLKYRARILPNDNSGARRAVQSTECRGLSMLVQRSGPGRIPRS
jgi:Protein of unknown function (DUF3365)